MAAALLRSHAGDQVEILSAGSDPAERVNPEVIQAMAELGIDLGNSSPQLLTPEAVSASDLVVTMGCGDSCPIFPGKRYLDWDLSDPADKSLAEIRPIRDEIDIRVQDLLRELVPDPTPGPLIGRAIREQVRARYAAAAVAVGGRGACTCADDSCCVPSDGPGDFGAFRYEDADRASLPEAAVLASLGCGNPTVVAELHPGETVLDLGSGGGIDVILSGKRVGPTGRVFGLDMTDEMLELAGRNAREAGASSVEFLKGEIESIPLPDEAVDVVLSNCVINLSADKGAVLREAYRVLRPGGRLAVSDVVAEDWLSAADRAERGSYVGCIAGALSRSEYERGLLTAGFAAVEVTESHRVADAMYGAIVRAVKPG
jgi:SAM-dependent methyltransferase/protein-tyrosine-phosphatase